MTVSSIRGHFSNITKWASFSNHTVSNVDVPNNFIDTGKTIEQYSLEDLIFSHPLLL